MTVDQLAQMEREAALENQKLNNEKLRHEISVYKLAEAERKAQNKRKAQALFEQRPENKYAAVRSHCTHKMGGKGPAALLNGQGNAAQYAVSKIKLPTGDVMIRCPRCRTKWIPPDPEDFKSGKAKYNGVLMTLDEARNEYNRAYNFETENAMISLPQIRWSRAGKPINREVTKRFVPELA